jgi:hypothetical protein
MVMSKKKKVGLGKGVDAGDGEGRRELERKVIRKTE